MIDPKFNKLPADQAGDFENIPESELSPEQRAARLQKPRAGLSINDTIAREANLSVGSRGADTSGVTAGSGAGAGLTSVTPGGPGESPAPNIVPGTRSSGTTPRGSTGVDQIPTTRMNTGSGAGTEQSAATRPSTGSGPTSEEIAARAHRCWHERGCPHGSPEIDWHRAEEELRRERAHTKTSGASA